MQHVFNSFSFSFHRSKCSFMKSFEYNGCVCVCMYCVLNILLLTFEPHFERICERKGEKYQERMEFARSRLWGKTVESFLFWFEFQLSINFINFLVTHNSIWMNKRDQITLTLKAIWFRLKMIQCTQSKCIHCLWDKNMVGHICCCKKCIETVYKNNLATLNGRFLENRLHTMKF